MHYVSQDPLHGVKVGNFRAHLCQMTDRKLARSRACGASVVI
jgi:hypothetical protein